jgi:aspartyl-tRNA(Asn)/glutamyl-tRNA(Gln) amidotransferase subunit C
MTSALPLSNVLRADQVKPSLSTEDALVNAPEAEDDQFRVQAVLE